MLLKKKKLQTDPIKKVRENNRKRIDANKAYKEHYKMNKNVWKKSEGTDIDAAHTKQLKKAEIMRFKDLQQDVILFKHSK